MYTQDMKVQMIDINLIVPYDKNPRKNKKAIEPVKKSLQSYGFQQPIVVDKNNVIIVGHTRWCAAKLLKYNRVPIIVADMLNDAQVTAYRIADNKTNEFADWDKDLLSSELLLTDGFFTGFEDPGLKVGEIGTQTLEPKLEVIIVECDTKYTQKDLYEKLIAEGHKCRIVMI